MGRVFFSLCGFRSIVRLRSCVDQYYEMPKVDRTKNSLLATSLSVFVTYPNHANDWPPIVLIHGAANSALIWKFWQQELAVKGWHTYAIDLRGHGRSASINLSTTTMNDYASDVHELCRQFKRPPILIGWSMGGLIAMMVAASNDAIACIALAPSMPAQQTNHTIELQAGEFTSEEYDIINTNPEEQPAMPDLDHDERLLVFASLCRESKYARCERKRGIKIKQLSCPLLIVTGSKDKYWPKERYNQLWLIADYIEIEGSSHWGLVLNRRVLSRTVEEVLAWIRNNVVIS